MLSLSLAFRPLSKKQPSCCDACESSGQLKNMGDVNEWSMMWGAKVKVRNDMPDDILKDAIETSRKYLEECENFETDGLSVAENIKNYFDKKWSPHWHVVIGRNFGSFCTHETHKFVFFYLEDKAFMLFKNSL